MAKALFTADQIRRIAREPHLIGHMVGKRKLTELHSRWARELWLPKHSTSIQAHRNAFKTTILTEVGSVWWLLFHPDDRICLLRETHTVASDTLRTISNYMKNELIQELFFAVHGFYPDLLVDRADRLTFRFKGAITKEGSIDSFGIETVPTGSHYDVILPDDVITIKDRFSPAKRERTCINMMEIMTNILEPGKFLRAVGTPWHKLDAWKDLPPPVKYDVYSTGILTPEQIEEKRSRMTRAMFAINYELKHETDDDATFKDPNPFMPWDTKRTRNIMAQVDARFKGTHGTALTIMGVRADGRYQVWGKVYDAHVKDVVDDILRECNKREATMLFVEDNADKGWAAELLGRSRPGLRPIHVQSYHETMNKQKKIEGFISDFWKRLVFSDDCDNRYLEEVFDYRGAEPDDAPDSLASLIREGYYDTDPYTSAAGGLYQE